MRAVAAPVGPARRRRRHPAVLLTLLLLGLVAAALLLELAFRLLWEPPPAFRDLQQAGMYVATAETGEARRLLGDARAYSRCKSAGAVMAHVSRQLVKHARRQLASVA